MKVMMEISLIVEIGGPRSSAETKSRVQAKLTQARELARKYLVSSGLEVVSGIESTRPLTKEESMFFVPRRVHYGDSYGKPLCERARKGKQSLNWDSVT